MECKGDGESGMGGEGKSTSHQAWRANIQTAARGRQEVFPWLGLKLDQLSDGIEHVENNAGRCLKNYTRNNYRNLNWKRKGAITDFGRETFKVHYLYTHIHKCFLITVIQKKPSSTFSRNSLSRKKKLDILTLGPEWSLPAFQGEPRELSVRCCRLKQTDRSFPVALQICSGFKEIPWMLLNSMLPDKICWVRSPQPNNYVKLRIPGLKDSYGICRQDSGFPDQNWWT